LDRVHSILQEGPPKRAACTRAETPALLKGPACRPQLDPLWDERFPGEQARIVQLLVERVEIAEDGLDIRMRTDGLAGLVREFGVDARAAA
jgi:hypothetical protein